MKDFLDICYLTSRQERLAFGSAWCGPNYFVPNQATLVAAYHKQPDGQPAVVYCTATSARFYTIVALPATNHMGEPKPVWKLNTGSDMATLAALIAESIASGMLALEP